MSSRAPAGYEETWRQEKESQSLEASPTQPEAWSFALIASAVSQKIPTALGLPVALLFTKKTSEPRVTLFKNCEKRDSLVAQLGVCLWRR